jgi:hypothetical protein
VLLILLLIWISTSCYLPIETKVPGFRDYYPAIREDFTPGKTTRAEVLLIMGEPDEQESNEKILIYNWSKNKGAFTLTGCDLTSLNESTSFKFIFDSEGILKSLDISQTNKLDW